MNGDIGGEERACRRARTGRGRERGRQRQSFCRITSPPPTLAGLRSLARQMPRAARAAAAAGRYKGRYPAVGHACDGVKPGKPLLALCLPRMHSPRSCSVIPVESTPAFKRPAACRPDRTRTAETAERPLRLAEGSRRVILGRVIRQIRCMPPGSRSDPDSELYFSGMFRSSTCAGKPASHRAFRHQIPIYLSVHIFHDGVYFKPF